MFFCWYLSKVCMSNFIFSYIFSTKCLFIHSALVLFHSTNYLYILSISIAFHNLSTRSSKLVKYGWRLTLRSKCYDAAVPQEVYDLYGLRKPTGFGRSLKWSVKVSACVSRVLRVRKLTKLWIGFYVLLGCSYCYIMFISYNRTCLLEKYLIQIIIIATDFIFNIVFKLPF